MITAISQSLLHFLWQGTLLGLVATTGLRILPPRLRYAFALAVFVVMATSPLATFALLYSQQQPVAQPGLILFEPPKVEATGAAMAGQPNWAPVILAIWLAGVTLMALRIAGGWILTRREFLGGNPVSEDLREAAARIQNRLGIHRPVRVAESITVRTPCIFGIWRPVVLLPAATIAGLPAAQLEAILAHELAHIARHDFLVNCLQCVVEAILFYHPAVWWLSKVIRDEREMCCDAIAAEYCGDPVLYSRALLTLEETRLEHMAVAATGGNLRQRIERLTGMDRPAQRSYGPVAMAMLLAVVALAVGVLAQEPASAKSLYQLWLTQDVVYIISPEEKVAFEALKLDEEREHFIEQFWLRRDPTPGTAENEAKEEHYRRIAYSNERFVSKIRQGWATARGRIYIVHGPPDEIESHPAPKRELWLYHKGMKCEFRGEEYELTGQVSTEKHSASPNGLFSQIDVDDVPEPIRGQLRRDLESFRGQPMSNALMDQVRAVVQRINPDYAARWSHHRPTGTVTLKVSPAASK